MQSAVIVRPKKKRNKEEEAWARTWVERHFTHDELKAKRDSGGRNRRKEGVAAGTRMEGKIFIKKEQK